MANILRDISFNLVLIRTLHLFQLFWRVLDEATQTSLIQLLLY